MIPAMQLSTSSLPLFSLKHHQKITLNIASIFVNKESTADGVL
jgi:hypothetical protein